MHLSAASRTTAFSERFITLLLVTILSVASTVLMLALTSPEFSWDEADYVASTANSWHFLWSDSDYNRHGHGPMAIYLAKLGQEVLPASVSLERRMRFFDALVASLGIGFLYWTLRRSFKTSKSAALVGSGLLLFSVIRLEETNVVGPHHLMLLTTLAIFGLGYHWRDQPTLQAGLGLGVAMGFGALSMTYVIPATLCWAMAITLAGSGWFTWNSSHFNVSWSIPIMLATATFLLLVLWPPGVLQHVVISNFRWYLHYGPSTALVGNHVVRPAPRWAALYWLAHLDAPILVFSLVILSAGVWKVWRKRRLSSKHAYLAICLAFLLGTALSAHLAGSRNLLQFIGVLCLATGALYDDAIEHDAIDHDAVKDRSRLGRFGAAAIIVVAALNLVWLSRSSSYIPFLATDGYRAFMKENQSRLQERVKAQAFNTPAFEVYAQATGTPVAWDLGEVAWNPRADAPLPADVKYVLIPAFIYDDMPPDQPMRRVVAAHWKRVWCHREGHAWELRLYENPNPIAP
ncbi:MAG: hypothetical protein WAN03_00115 [Candidatus Sulfotelmatobacter sp.]